MTVQTYSTLQSFFAPNGIGAITAGNLQDFVDSTLLNATITGNGSDNTSALQLNGTLYTSGTSSTNIPHLFFQTGSATAVTTWSTAGTYFGINADSAFGGNFIDFRVNGNAASSCTINTTGIATNLGNFNLVSAASNGAASTSVMKLVGTLFTGGTGTTNFPQYLAQSSAATAASNWSTSGTYLGVNADSGFAGNFIDFRTNGGGSLFSVSAFGGINCQSTIRTSTTGAASTAVLSLTGAPYSAGTSTTNYPQYLAQTSAATAVTSWSTAGTYIGINTNSGFGGNFVDFRINGSAASSCTINSTGIATNLGNFNLVSAASNGAASTSVLKLVGTLFTGGTGTTTLPQYLAQSGSATAASTWSTSGTFIGINADSGFTGNFLDFRLNGGSSLASLTYYGGFTVANTINAGASISGTNIIAGSSNYFSWNGGALSKMTSPSDGTIQFTNTAATGFTALNLGPTVAAPTAVSIVAGSVVTGTTNTAGANLTIAGSRGTGTGAGGSLIFQTAPAGSTGTSQNALSTALTIDANGNVTATGTLTCNNNIVGTTGQYLSGNWNYVAGGGLGLRVANNMPYSFSSTATASGTVDTGLSRISANLVGVGNGTAGDFSGGLKLGSFIISNSTTPATSSATGTTGTIAWDSSFLYCCVATNTWKRVAIATW